MFGPSLLISVLQMCHLCADLDLGLVATSTEILNVPQQHRSIYDKSASMPINVSRRYFPSLLKSDLRRAF